MSDIYHEKQRLQFCAVHALNNLFQDGKFCSREKLDDVCLELNGSGVFNPHRSMLRIGNYDVNVIIMFLKKLNYDVIWFDKRRDVSCLNTNVVKGFLCNTTSPIGLFGLKVRYFKHWYAITRIEDVYYNLDSKLSYPMEIGGEDDVKRCLQDILSKGESELLIVTSGRVDQQTVYGD